MQRVRSCTPGKYTYQQGGEQGEEQGGAAHLANTPGCTIHTCTVHHAATWHLSLVDANFAMAQTKDCYWVRMQNVQLAVATTLVGDREKTLRAKKVVESSRVHEAGRQNMATHSASLYCNGKK